MARSDYLNGWQAKGKHGTAPCQIATQRRLQQSHIVCSGRILDLNVTLDCVDMSFTEIYLLFFTRLTNDTYRNLNNVT